MTKLVQHDVEEFQQMRGQRRKLTKALFVISMLKPMSDDSRNFPLIVLEAFKDILCDFREARTSHGPSRPMAAIKRAHTLSLRVYPRILTGYHFRGNQCVW